MVACFSINNNNLFKLAINLVHTSNRFNKKVRAMMQTKRNVFIMQKSE